jgi:hypothetical protein
MQLSASFPLIVSKYQSTQATNTETNQQQQQQTMEYSLGRQRSQFVGDYKNVFSKLRRALKGLATEMFRNIYIDYR